MKQNSLKLFTIVILLFLFSSCTKISENETKEAKIKKITKTIEIKNEVFPAKRDIVSLNITPP